MTTCEEPTSKVSTLSCSHWMIALGKRRLLLSLFLALFMALTKMAGSAWAANFSTDFSSDPGAPLGTAIVEAGVLKLTTADVNQRGAWVLADLDAGANIGAFRATFRARIGGGTARPAQGFSFVFANDLPADAAFGEGGGSSKGLVLSFDTTDNNAGFGAEGNDPGDAPGVILKFGGVKIAARKADNLKTDERFVDVAIQLDADGTLDVTYDGVKIFDNFAFAYTPIAGNFGFGAATSDLTAALNANHWIDDLRITTTPLAGAFVISALPAARNAPPDAVVRIRLGNLTSQTVQMTFDGGAVTPTVTRDGTATVVTYDPPGLLASGSNHSVRLTYEGSRVLNLDFQVMQYVTLPPSAAAPAGSVNTGSSGFKVRVYQVANPPPTTVAAAERQLAGLSGRNLANLQGAAADGTFNVPLINFDENAAEAGNFNASTGAADEQTPGIPGLDSEGNEYRDNYAAEIIAYLDLAPGAYTFGVNSDDGFRLTAGSDPRDVAAAYQLGIFDGGRGAADSIFSFAVEQAGIYPIRLVWYEIGSGSNAEFFSVDSTGKKILINDRNTAGHVKAYRDRAAAFRAAPYVSSLTPTPGQADVSTRPKIEVQVTEDQTVLDPNSVRLTINGNPVTPVVSKSGKITTVTFQGGAQLSGLSQQTVQLQYVDNANNQVSREWKFTTGKARTGFVSNVKGYWTFDDGTFKATIGSDIQPIDPSLANQFVFGATGTGAFADIPHISGQPAKFVAIPRQEGDLFRKMGLRVRHGVSPNGGGKLVNQWTLIMDVLWGEGHGFGTVLRTHDLDKDIDGDMFWRGSDGAYGKGCCSNYDGINPANSHQRGQWARVVFAVDLAGTPRLVGKYINGVKHRDDVGGDGNALDSRFALPSEIFMFNDGDDNEQSTVYVSAIQFREGKLTDDEIRALGGPSAAGIPLPAPVAGQWDFDNGTLAATHGQPLTYIDPSLAGNFQFGTTGAGAFADIPHIGGKPAKFLFIPRMEGDLFRKMGLRMRHGIPPNGGGKLVNQWTLIMDVLWGEGHGFGTVLRTHDFDRDIDGDLFWRGSDGAYGKGCCSSYDGISQEPGKNHARGQWARVVFTVDLSATPRVFGKYVNGFKHRDDVGGDANALDSRFALPPEVFLFNDGDDNEQSPAYINAIQIREGRLTDDEIMALGGPSADGIPVPRVSPVTAQWDFDVGNLKATVGEDLAYIDNSLASQFAFGSTGAAPFADIPHIGGQPAKFIVIPRQEGDLFRKMGLRAKHGVPPNGGGKLANQWTLIMDLLWGEGHGFGTVLRTHDFDRDIDGDLFWRGSDGAYGKGCCSSYDGISPEPGKNHARGQWARVVFTVDLASTPRVFGKYVNGFKHRDDVGGDGNALDSRFALPPEIFLFNDGDDNEQSTVYVNSIQFREGRLTDEEIAALGGPSASGIPGQAVSAPPPPPPSAPSVSAGLSGGNLVISWPAGVTGYVLEETDNLGAPNWRAVTGVTNNRATIAISGTTKFYRLRRQ